MDTPDDEYIAKFVLLREPNTPKLMLYSVPPDAFEPSDGSGDRDHEWGAGEKAAAAVATAGHPA